MKLLKDFAPLILLVITFITLLKLGENTGTKSSADAYKSTFATPQLITYETDSHFYNGQILPPDEVHTDTLIVVNGDSLTYWMENYDVSCNGDVLDLLNMYTVPK